MCGRRIPDVTPAPAPGEGRFSRPLGRPGFSQGLENAPEPGLCAWHAVGAPLRLRASQGSAGVRSRVAKGPGPAQRSSPGHRPRARSPSWSRSLRLQPRPAGAPPTPAPPTCPAPAGPRPPLPRRGGSRTRWPNPDPTAPSAGQKGSCSGARGEAESSLHTCGRPPAGPLGICTRALTGRAATAHRAGPQAAGSLPAGAWGCGGRGAWRAPGCWLCSPARGSVRGCPGQGAADLACDPRSQGTCGRQTADLRLPGLEGTRRRCRGGVPGSGKGLGWARE